MKKLFLFLSFISAALFTDAQNLQIDKLKKELENHPRQDTFRVNRLNDLQAEGIPFDERKKYADEALAISQKVNYVKGQGFAWMNLAVVSWMEKNLPESKSRFHLADSIANVTGDQELKANVLLTKAYAEPNAGVRDSLLQQAYTITKKTDKLELQAKILTSLAAITGDTLKKKALYLQADSIEQKAGNLRQQAWINYRMGSSTKDLQDRKALYRKADSIMEKSGELEDKANLLHDMGQNLALTGDKNALNYYLRAEDAAKKSGNKVKLSFMQNSIGFYYQNDVNDYAKAMEYYLKGLRTAEIANDTANLIDNWFRLGSLYTSLGDQDNALSYLLKAEEANKILGNKGIEWKLQNSFGEIYRLSGKYPEAIKAYNKSIELLKVLYSQGNIRFYINESNLADVYTRMDSLTLAFYYGFRSLKDFTEHNDLVNEAWVEGILSRAYLKKNMPDSAIYYGGLGLATAKTSGSIEFMRDNTLALANAYAAKKDFKNAYANHLLYINYRDSMVNTEVRNRTAVQLYTFNLDKKEAQISSLNQDKKYQLNLLKGAIVLLFLILATAALLFLNNRQKQKANRLLKKQKQEIDEKAGELANQKDNVELLSDIGRKITASLSVEKIIGTVYDNVNTLMDANVFGIGIYNDELKRIEFPATYENGAALPFYTNDIDDKNRFGAVCFTTGKEVITGNVDEEYKHYIQEVQTPHEGEQPVSVIFLPLMAKGEKLGVITVQSFKKNAYSDYQLFMLRNIATYTAIAIENAEAYETLNKTFSTLKSTQKQLIQSEKMASLGELTAGIAHEIQNPLNFVNNFSEVNTELIYELQEEAGKGNMDEVKAIANDIKENEQKINYHGKRAGDIVKGMLQHSRSSTGVKEPTDINALADEYLQLSYHGLRAKDKSFNATMKTDFDESLSADEAGIGKINIIPQDIGRVLLNLFNNAFYAVSERQKAEGLMQEESVKYKPTVSVKTSLNPSALGGAGDAVIITVSDNGNGIPQKIVDKIFQPFFTTKPTGQGTGLGLSLSYDIIKAHGGEIKVESLSAEAVGKADKEGEGTKFIIRLPVV